MTGTQPAGAGTGSVRSPAWSGFALVQGARDISLVVVSSTGLAAAAPPLLARETVDAPLRDEP